jgi:hypothetical protein
MPLVYTSQTWWDALTPEQRNNMSVLRLSELQSLNDLVEGGTEKEIAAVTRKIDENK